MPLRSWYSCGTKHFHLTMVVRRKWKTQQDWVIKPVLHDLVRRIGFWRIKSPEQDIKYVYGTISKMLFWNLFSCKGTQMIDWVGRIVEQKGPTFEQKSPTPKQKNPTLLQKSPPPKQKSHPQSKRGINEWGWCLCVCVSVHLCVCDLL